MSLENARIQLVIYLASSPGPTKIPVDAKDILKLLQKTATHFIYQSISKVWAGFNFYNISRGRQSVKKTKSLTTNCCVTHIKTKPLRPLEYLTLTSSFYTMIKKSMPLSPPLPHTMSCLTAVLQNLVSFFRSLTF